MIMLRRGIAVAAACCALGATLPAQTRPAPPATPRIYIFDGGSIKGLNPSLFNFTREEIKEPDFVVVSYLIVHPRGTLMFRKVRGGSGRRSIASAIVAAARAA